MNDAQQAIDRQVLVQQRPVDAIAGWRHLKIVSFLFRGPGQGEENLTK
jgi:hypothetical protein